MATIYTLSTREEPWNIRYVGKTNETLHRRLKRHLSSYYLNEKTHKANWIKSELKKGHTIIIETLDEVSECEWVIWEKYWIKQLKSLGFELTNGTIGGEGILLTDDILKRRTETIIKKSEKRFSKLIKKYKIKEVNGYWICERICECGHKVFYKNSSKRATIHSITRSKKENRKCLSCKNAGELNHFYGKKLNDGKIKRERYGTKIIQLDLNGKKIATFKSIREAAEKTGIDRKSISRCSRNIKSYNTAGGYKFKIKTNELHRRKDSKKNKRRD